MDERYIFNNNRIDEEKAVNVHELLNKFLRRKNLFLYIAIPIFFIILVAQVAKPHSPIYRATFDIGVSKERPVDGFFSSSQVTPTLQIGTVTQRVISNLLSISLAEKVVDTLGFYAHLKNGDPEVRVEAKLRHDFENPIGPLKLHIKDRGYKISINGVTTYEGRLDEYTDFDLFSLKVVTLADNTDGRTYTLTIYPRDIIALALRNSLSIRVLEADKIEQEMGSSGLPFSGEGASKELVTAKTIFPGMNLIGILRISVHWGNPGDALKIARVLAEKIIEVDKSEKSLQFVQSRIFIDNQLNQYQEKLNNLEEDIRLFKARKKITDLKASTQALIGQISQLESQKSQKQIEENILKDLSGYLSVTETSPDETPNFASSLVSDPVLQAFYGQLLQTEADLRGKLKEYSSNHPKVMEVRAKLGGLKDQMQQEVKKRTSSIAAEVASVENQIRFLQEKLENVPEDEILLARLERDRETAEKLYTFFSEKLEETRVQEAGVTSDLKIINPPLVSSAPVNAKNPLVSFMFALFISFAIGCCAVFVAEYIDNTVKDPEIVQSKIGLPLFATIPVVEDLADKEDKVEKDAIGVLKGIVKNVEDKIRKRKIDQPLRIIDEKIAPVEFEAFRKLSINLDFAAPDKEYRLIYITSSGPEEGKTFLTINLASALSAMAKKVIVIDTDFRKKKGHLTDVTTSKKAPGLFDILKKEINLHDAIVKFNPEHVSSKAGNNDKKGLEPVNGNQYAVDLISAGEIPANPFVYFASPMMKNILCELKDHYDYILIDGVPVLLFADAPYLAQFADGVLLTAKYGKTGFKELENSKNILLAAKARIIGLIMNGVPKTRGSYYYQYYHKYYSKYYRQDS